MLTCRRVRAFLARQLAKFLILLPVSAVLLTLSCGIFNNETMLLTGRLTHAIQCIALDTGDEMFELRFYDSAEIPPLGAQVTMLVKKTHGLVSSCMIGEIVDVLEIREVEVDFRTDPVRGHEIWRPDNEPVILGQVDVEADALLEIYPGTTVWIIPEGRLHVYGTILMVGSAVDTIIVRCTEDLSSGMWMGHPAVVLDSSATGSALQYAKIPNLAVYADGLTITHVSSDDVEIKNADVSFEECRIGHLQSANNDVIIGNSMCGDIYGSSTDFTLEACEFQGYLSLSYSRGDVTDCVFLGPYLGILFHGESYGSITTSTFHSEQKAVEIRHRSRPSFSNNNFLNPGIVIECSSYQLDQALDARNNWWGTTDSLEIASKVCGECNVDFRPWLTEPVPEP